MTRFRFSESHFSPYFVSSIYKDSKAGQFEKRVSGIYYSSIYYKVIDLYTLARRGLARAWDKIQYRSPYRHL